VSDVKINPPKKAIGKGVPPASQDASNNLVKNMEGDLVAFNFRVPAEFRKKVRQHALDHDTTAVKIMMDALDEYINK